jgi:septal ring factor EnvC (AmiA/AmiB activator)
MTAFRALARTALSTAMIAALLLPPGASHAESTQSRLRKEKARLTEMRERAEKAAAELDKALEREQTSRKKVDEIRKQLADQRRLITRIDRKLSSLSREMARAESEVRAIEQSRESTQRGLERAAVLAFREGREASSGFRLAEAGAERQRYFMELLLASEVDQVDRLAADQEKKESALTGIERQVQLSEKRISKEKKVGESLLTQRKKEAERLAEIQKEKKRKEKEVKALRSRVARMEALVSRIERQVREAERRRPGGGRREGPSKFSGIPGGLVAPVRGKVVGPFGKYQDPVFHVEVENHGVEIEASSGAPIRSVGKGNVVFSGAVAGFGNVLIIQHGTGLFSVYGKAESFSVGQGQVVGPGQNIGRLPASPGGKSVLYLELRAAGTAIDPTAVIPFPR